MAEARPRVAAREWWGGTGRRFGDGPSGDVGGYAAPLDRTIEMQVLPRLVLAHAGCTCEAEDAVEDGAGSDEVATLTARVVAGDDTGALAYVESLLAHGMPAERIFLDVLGGTARRLGDLWNSDACTFPEVTLGLWRLHRVLRALSAAFECEVEHQQEPLPVLLVPVPGEQHTFGLSVAAEFFRRAGWVVWDAPVPTRSDLVAMVRDEWFAVVGLSASCECRLEALASCISLVRRESCNRSIGILVGGRVFAEHPEYVSRVGADVAALDARQAPVQAQHLVAALAHRT